MRSRIWAQAASGGHFFSLFGGIQWIFLVFLQQNTPKFRACGARNFLLFRGIQRQIWLEAGAEGARKFWFSGRIKGGLERKQRAGGARKNWVYGGFRDIHPSRSLQYWIGIFANSVFLWIGHWIGRRRTGNSATPGHSNIGLAVDWQWIGGIWPPLQFWIGGGLAKRLDWRGLAKESLRLQKTKTRIRKSWIQTSDRSRPLLQRYSLFCFENTLGKCIECTYTTVPIRN